MITARAFAGKSYCVLGLARSGLATVEALLASGADVTAWDRQEEPRMAAAAMGAALGDPLEIDLAGFDGVVVSPGVPLNTHPIGPRAAAAGVKVIGDIELFAQARASLPPHKVVGITGTNGKSTTTALVTHILTQAGVPALMGGNIGLPILGQQPLPAGGVYVLELSSYQIDLTYSLDCDVAVLLNVTPDHLDRYVSFEAYAASKKRLLEMQLSSTSIGYVNTGCETSLEIFNQLSAESRAAFVGNFSAELAHDLAPNPEDDLWEAAATSQSDWPALQGPHNAANAVAAIYIAMALNVPDEYIGEGLRTFTGLPHRMEILGTCSGILFVNDSKATNPDSTAPALAAWPPNPERRVHWICGGLPKDDNLDVCLAQIGNVARAYTIGEAGPMFAELLAPHVPVERCEMMCEALQRALAHARSGDVILLSPACASFDQFRDYEARGAAFRELVAGLTAGNDRSSAA